MTSQGTRKEHGNGDEEQPVVRDRRRIDPVTGALREPGHDAPAPAAGDTTAAAAADASAETTADVEADTIARELDAEVERARGEAAERLADLQRLQAEYTNYRRRVDRDREAVRDAAVASVLAELLPVLDDIGRARDHGDLTGAFKSVAEALEQVVTKLGLVRFGEPGDRFDPTVHEALAHSYSDEVDEPTAVEILMPGYRFGERIVRPARVAVAEPTEALPDTEGGGSGA